MDIDYDTGLERIVPTRLGGSDKTEVNAWAEKRIQCLFEAKRAAMVVNG